MIIKDKNKFKSGTKSKILVLGLILIALVGIFSPITIARAVDTTTYNLLAPLPQLCPNGTTGDCTIDTSGTGSIGKYLNPMITLFIGICAVLAVVMIVIGGIEVMTSELAHTKQAGKERILNALLGLLIALGAYALLYTINPDLLNSDINNMPNVSAPAPANYPAH